MDRHLQSNRSRRAVFECSDYTGRVSRGPFANLGINSVAFG